MVCGCDPDEYGDCHGDIRRVTLLNISGSVDATGLDPLTVVDNLKTSLDNFAAEYRTHHPHDHEHRATALVSRATAHYRAATVEGQNCGLCRFMQSDGSCERVQGQVDRQHVCDLFAGETQRSERATKTLALFADQQ